MSRIYVNLDIETTGLDPERDHILEIAWAILDEDFDPIFDAREFIVDHGSNWPDVVSALRAAPAVVRNMHVNSGLAGDLLGKGGSTLQVIADSLYRDINVARAKFAPNTTAHLMGFSPEFDRSFLSTAPWFTSVVSESPTGLNHRLYNLSSVKIAYENAGIEIPAANNPNPHRALHDITEVMRFAQLVKADLEGKSL